MHGAHHAVFGADGIAAGHPGNAKVRHFDMPIGVHQNILRLDIPMDNAVFMGMLKRRKNTDANLGGHSGRQCALLADEKDIRLHFETNAAAFRMPTDSEKLERILNNLVSNALRLNRISLE